MFEEKLREYAQLLVEVGLHVQPGQTVRLTAPVDGAPLARLCARACYDCGAREVINFWTDDFMSREKYLKADPAVFGEFPAHKKAESEWLLEKKAVSLSLIGEDPENLKGVDPVRIHAWQKVSRENTRSYFDAMTASQFQWTVAAHPTAAWARKVYPGLPAEQAVDRLWDAIFSVCRITGDGLAGARWQEHINTTGRRCQQLNRYQFQSLRYRNALGTDLTITLPENHIWQGGAEKSGEGISFVANIPTEEIFTAPRRDGVEGRVYAALPLALNGNLVTDIRMDFSRGKIVDVHASQGEEILRQSIALDEGSSYLGEVSLVPYDSPIRNSGILFYETLFDENASCHLAFGSSYPSCVQGGTDMDPEGLKAAGLNQSINHVDFMVGTEDLSIVGRTHDGAEIPVFVDGNFAF